MRHAAWLAAVAGLLFANAPVAAAPGDAEAHTKLTDGIRATSDPNHAAWLTLYGDSTQLPRTQYDLGEFCFWGISSPMGGKLSPTDTPQLYELIKDGGHYGVRYNMIWNGMEQNGPGNINYNWYATEDNINKYVADGHTVIGLLTYTPAWANGHKTQEQPPSTKVEQELVDLSSGVAVLNHAPVVSYDLVITPPNPTLIRHTEEIIETNFQEGDAPRTSVYPCVVGTQRVWVDENDGRGWVEWTHVDNLINSPGELNTGAEHYMFDRDGYVRFRYNRLFWYHGKVPKAGSKVKITYDTYAKTYVRGVDYTYNHLTGEINARTGVIHGALPYDGFGSSTLNSTWKWMNTPAAWNVNQTVPGNLHFQVTPGDKLGVGNFLHQDLSGNGEFSVSMKVSDSSWNGQWTQCGVMVYQDAQNWFRYAISRDSGRPYLTINRNGQVSSIGSKGELGFQCFTPRRVNVRKSGNKFTVFTSKNNPNAPDGDYQWEYEFEQEFTWPIKVGISAVATGTGQETVAIDEFQLNFPTIGESPQVRISYDYLDVESWKNFVRSTVNHFKDRINYWEMWNEPDQGWCWDRPQDVMAIMIREGSKAVREADPDAQVIAAGYANGANHHYETIYQTIGKDWFDYTAWHPYLFKNVSPDASGWMHAAHGPGREAMERHGDADKEVFLGELSTTSGVLCNGGGMNERKQADYGLRLAMMSRKLGWVKGIQWWPVRDIAKIGEQEDYHSGGHDGLLYEDGTIKPVYWTYRAAAVNKGILLDLVNYGSDDVPDPVTMRHNLNRIVIGARDRANVAAVKVYTSLTATADDSRPPKVVARHLGQAGTAPFVVNVAAASQQLKTEKWTLTAISPTQFSVTGALSGAQGTATVGSSFTSSNGVVTLTIPQGAQRAYIAGDRFEFETFKGDGWVERVNWTNPGTTGAGDLVINFPAAEARYVSIQFVKAAGKTDIGIDEVGVYNAAGTNVAQGKLYVVDGYQDFFKPATVPDDPDPTDPDPGKDPDPPVVPEANPVLELSLSGLPSNPRPGQEVTLTVAYTNVSPVSAASVAINCPLPPYTAFVPGSASAGGIYDSNGDVIRWVLPSISSGQSGTLNFRVLVQ